MEAGSGVVRSLGPTIALGALKQARDPLGKGAGGVQGTPYSHALLAQGGGTRPPTSCPHPLAHERDGGGRVLLADATFNPQ